MAAQTITNLIAPRLEFSSPGGGSVIIKIFDTVGNIWGICEISTATWLAMTGAALTGVAPSISNGGPGGITYIPKNVYSNPIGDGRITYGGQLNPVAAVDVA